MIDNKVDLIGMQFNEWTVLYRDFERESEIERKTGRKSPKYWRCRCTCGREKSVLSFNLRSGASKSCGKHRESPNNFCDLRGQIFGRLLVLKRAENGPNWKVRWNCVCSCGNLVSVTAEHLKSGHTRSCGCFQKDRANETHFKDLTGKKFGKLLVISRNFEYQEKKDSTQTYWNCICDCGEKTVVTGGKLVFGHTQSCGCVQSFGELKIKELLRKNNIKYLSNYTFKDCLSDKNRKLKYDFAIFDNLNNLKYLIEFDGVQHFICQNRGWATLELFEGQQKRDRIKDKYCFENKIPIIRIPYVMLNFFTLDDIKIETSNFILTRENEEDYYKKYIDVSQ